MKIILENVVPEGFRKETEHNIMYGTCNGLMAIIVPVISEGYYRVLLELNIEKSEHKTQFLEQIQKLKNTYPFVGCVKYDEEGTIVIHVLSGGKEDKENLTQLLQAAAKKCVEYQISSCCYSCKSEKPLNTAAIDGKFVLICEECLKRLADKTEPHTTIWLYT